MARVPFTEAELTEQARQFAASIEAPRARWEYCLAASHFKYRNRRGEIVLCPNPRSVPTAVSILGRRKYWVDSGFRRLREHGYDGALAIEAEHRAKYPCMRALTGDMFDVGPLKAWSIGHVYFARVDGFPHVMKIGFSRRVHARLDDIESANRTRLIVRPGHLKVGTLLNEHWWHRDWQKFCIAGEWFFDPSMTDRTLPDFLRAMAEAA
jgi:hypothetical protein